MKTVIAVAAVLVVGILGFQYGPAIYKKITAKKTTP